MKLLKKPSGTATVPIDWPGRISAIVKEIESLENDRAALEVERGSTARHIVSGDTSARSELEALTRKVEDIDRAIGDRNLELATARLAHAEAQQAERAEAERQRQVRIRELTAKVLKLADIADAAAIGLRDALAAYEETALALARESWSQVLDRRIRSGALQTQGAVSAGLRNHLNLSGIGGVVHQSQARTLRELTEMLTAGKPQTEAPDA